MLDAQTIATVKATIPLLVETGPKLTAHFYDRMFAHNPELKEIFNMSNQRNGDQREALFNAIAAYASNIENLAALLRQMSAMGNNINQIAKVANSSKFIRSEDIEVIQKMQDELWQAIKEL